MTAAQLETWKNNTEGRFVMRRVDPRGQIVDELIPAHRTFTCTPEERRMNSDSAASREVDAFHNGTLIPVRLIDGEIDAEEIAQNPNLLSDADLKKLFKTKGEGFGSQIAGISNPATLQRLVELANEVDASVGQLRAIEARLEAVAPPTAGFTAVGTDGAVRTSVPDDGRMRPVTPR